MLRVLTKIVFTQIPTADFPSRNKVLNLNFCHSYEASDSWADLTNKAKIVLPKNIYVKDASGKVVSLQGTNKNIGGFSDQVPLFLKGDQVSINAGYRYFDFQRNEVDQTAQWFQGYITNVQSKMTFELELQDNMYRLKQIAAPNKVFPASKYSLEDILKELLQGTKFTVNTLTNTSFGDFRTQNETVAEVLARLRKDYHFESYFRGNELRCGSIVYVEQDAITDGQIVFKFQDNIIEDDLDYKRKDDVNLSAVAYSINSSELNATTKDGQTKTRKNRLEVLVTNRNGQFIHTVVSKGDKPVDPVGERRTLYFWNFTDPVELGRLAEQELKKYYYTGLRGHFITFGTPFVRMGDNIDLIDTKLVERCGRYKVKSVHYSGGVDGLRQKIETDYLISRLDVNGNTIS
jgi:hypothetical protein